jgi:MFS family permease
MIALALSMFVAALDQTIVSTAIPTIAAHFHSAAGYTWIGGAYLLANAAGACIWAKLSDIWGRKPILLLAVGWFFISSIICATAVNMRCLLLVVPCKVWQVVVCSSLSLLSFLIFSA